MELEEGYVQSESYKWYSEYEDTQIWEMGADRTMPEIKQVTMMGDTNSQYLTFQMPRYFDGSDLTQKSLMVRWFNDQNIETGGDYADICNFRYNDELIRFAWLLGYGVTEYAGAVGFCFQYIGTNENGDTYVWKTGIGKVRITENLETGAGGDEPSADWFSDLLAKIDALYAAAQTAEDAAASVDESKQKAEDAAEKANQAADNATDAADKANASADKADTAAANANDAANAANTAAADANDAANAANTAAADADEKAQTAEDAAANADEKAQTAEDAAAEALRIATAVDLSRYVVFSVDADDLGLNATVFEEEE